MKTIQDLIEEKDDSQSTDTRQNTLNFIASNFYRFTNAPDESDSKSLLMLIAALSVLNMGDDNPNAVQVAKRLAQLALVRSGKKKGKTS